MQFPENTETRDRQIGDFLLQVPQPYAEGQTMTAGEAAALNQVLAENTSNNLRAKLKAGVTEGDTTRPYTDAEAQALVTEYLGEYEMGVRSGGGRISDPIEREARRLAMEKAKDLVKSKGRKIKDVDIQAIADTIYDNNVEALTKAAKTLVAAQSKASAAADELGASIEI